MIDEYFAFLDLIANQGIGVLHVDSRFSPRWNKMTDMERHDCRGDLSFITNVPEIKDVMIDWSWNKMKSYMPKSADHIADEDEEFGTVLKLCYQKSDVHKLAKTCFVAEEIEDREDLREDINEGAIDEPEDPEEGNEFLSPDEIARLKEIEEEMLAKIPLPGAPIQESETRKKWIKPLRKARLAIRKMHKEWGHLPRSVLKNILKIAKADESYIKAAEYLRCDDCEKNHKPKQTSKTAPPKPYMFNFEVGIEVLDLHDCEGNTYQFLNIVCQGTDFQMVIYLKKGHA